MNESFCEIPRPPDFLSFNPLIIASMNESLSPSLKKAWVDADVSIRLSSRQWMNLQIRLGTGNRRRCWSFNPLIIASMNESQIAENKKMGKLITSFNPLIIASMNESNRKTNAEESA